MTRFICEKKPATGSRGMVVTNHPLASAAGAEIMLSGGNAIDAAVASLFALTVVEPMMVGILGGGITHLRLADGRHIIIDGLSTAPSQATPDMFQPISNGLASGRDTLGRKNHIGALAIAVPGALAAWCHALQHYGSLPLSIVMAPAIRLAKEGFTVTPYLSNCIKDCAADLMTDRGLAALFLPRGKALRAGKCLQQKDYAKTLRLIAKEGPAALYEGTLGDAVISHITKAGGVMRKADLAQYKALEREPIVSPYRGHIIVGPPPPASSGVHIAQMLNLLEAYDMKSLGFGSVDSTHLLAEVMKIAFADRAVATADPAFIAVPVEKLISKSYAKKRVAELDMAQAQHWSAGLASGESADTTHLTVADDKGNVVSATQTINGLFGACVQIEGTGMLANNYMYNFDPTPSRALSIAPGKRCFTSMAPMMVLRDGRLRFALGLPGALRIFPSAMQTIINVIDHGMSIQQAVEAPRIWCEGGPLELEPAFSDDVAKELSRRGHQISRESRVAGGMNAIAFGDDGTLTGAACWRADGTPVGIAGGLAREGMRFTTN
jgi:gamma-glutamyltranspeptidase / glutathione hydrolase